MFDIMANVLGGLMPILDAYRKTTHGENPWTWGALLNVIRLRRHIDRARAVVGGKVNSVYRSPQINALVNGHPESFHLAGAAADISYGAGWTLDTAAEALNLAALRGELGPVHKVVKEPATNIVHVQWFKSGAPARHTPVFVTDERSDWGRGGLA